MMDAVKAGGDRQENFASGNHMKLSQRRGGT